MSAAVESARADWAEGNRRFHDELRRAPDSTLLQRALEIVVDGLRRRLGAVFTLGELADVYVDAEGWVRASFEEQLPSGWAAGMTTVQDAAFHLYSRSALDYAP